MDLIVLDAKGAVGPVLTAALPQVNVTVVTDVDALGLSWKPVFSIPNRPVRKPATFVAVLV